MSLLECLELMYQARAVPAPDTMQAGGLRYTWVTIGVDGTNWLNRGYVHRAVAGPWSGPNDLANWCLFEESENGQRCTKCKPSATSMPPSGRLRLCVYPMLMRWNAGRCSSFGPMAKPM